MAEAPRKAGTQVLWLFALTMLLSAFLLFLVQPVVARMLVPLLGGTPAVWNTCMVFFQSMLLLGYLYAHGLEKFLPGRRAVVVHLPLLVIALIFLPMAVPDSSPPVEGTPVLWLLGTLFVMIGLPFLLVSASAPLFQSWFFRTGHPQGKDPYHLYAASNAGSMAALLGYPFVVEPMLAVSDQAWLWTGGYVALIGAATVCGVTLWRMSAGPAEPAVVDEAADVVVAKEDAPTWTRRFWWIVYAFIPSSLILGVTTYISTDLGSVPLFWVVPLALYLLTFILVFASRPPISHRWLVELAPIFLLALFASKIRLMPIYFLVALHLVTFFIVAMVFHGKMVRSRPSAHHLTEFYLLMSLGGVLGGAFNALLAPVIFNTYLEYFLVLAVALPLIGASQAGGFMKWDFRTKLYVLGAGLGLVVSLGFAKDYLPDLAWEAAFLVIVAAAAWLIDGLGKPGRAILTLAAALLIVDSMGLTAPGVDKVHKRSFFATHVLWIEHDNNATLLVHGSTVHGIQRHDPEHVNRAQGYHAEDGPLGQIVADTRQRLDSIDAAIVGLGAGVAAAYVEPGDHFDFFEIDPVVVEFATDERYFTYMSRCGAPCHIILGDGRLTLAAVERKYDLVVLDAYNSDSIPIHLITLEAVQMYVERLKDDGLLVFNISNRHLDVSPVLANLAQELNLKIYGQEFEIVEGADVFSSRWVVMAREDAHLASLLAAERWAVVPPEPAHRLWTDDYSNLLQIYTWK